MNEPINEATAIDLAKKFMDGQGMLFGEAESVSQSHSGKSWEIVFEASAARRARFVGDPDHGPIVRVEKKTGKVTIAYVI